MRDYTVVASEVLKLETMICNQPEDDISERIYVSITESLYADQMDKLEEDYQKNPSNMIQLSFTDEEVQYIKDMGFKFDYEPAAPRSYITRVK